MIFATDGGGVREKRGNGGRQEGERQQKTKYEPTSKSFSCGVFSIIGTTKSSSYLKRENIFKTIKDKYFLINENNEISVKTDETGMLLLLTKNL